MLTYIKCLTCSSVLATFTLIYTRNAEAYKFAYDDHVYTVHYGNYEWSRARVVCFREGGDLMEIKDAGTQNEVMLTLGSQVIETEGFWIGAMRLQKEIASSWLWPSGKKVDYYNWLNSTVETQQGECIMIRANDFKWQNYPCYNALYQFSFICSNSTTTASLEPYVSSVTPNTNATVFYPGKYFEIDVEITIPTILYIPFLCIKMIAWLVDYFQVRLYVLMSSVEIEKNLKDTSCHEEEQFARLCCVYNLRNREGIVDNNVIRVRYGALVMFSTESVIRISTCINSLDSTEQTVHFPLTFSYILKYPPLSKIPLFAIPPSSTEPKNIAKDKTLIYIFDAYIPYLYAFVKAEVSSSNNRNSSILGIAWIKLDQVGWNYEEDIWEGRETLAGCDLKTSLELIVESLPNRGIYLSSNTTENDLLRFKVCLYFTEQPSEILTYPLNVRISYQQTERHKPDKMDHMIRITTTNFSKQDYAEMVANLSLESFIDKSVNSTNRRMTITVDTIINTVYSYYMLVFMDVSAPIKTVQIDNVTVTNAQRNLGCVRVNFFMIELREMTEEAKRRELAVMQMNASNIFNVSDDENTVTLTMVVKSELQNIQINVTFVTLETYLTLMSNTSTSLDVSDELCGSRSIIIQTNIFLILVAYLVYQFVIP